MPADSARVLGALRGEFTRALAGRWVVVASAPGAAADLRVAVLTYAHTDHLPWHYGGVALQVDVAAGAAAGSGTVARGAARRWDPRANRATRVVLDAARAQAVRHVAAFVDSARGGALTPPPRPWGPPAAPPELGEGG